MQPNQIGLEYFDLFNRSLCQTQLQPSLLKQPVPTISLRPPPLRLFHQVELYLAPRAQWPLILVSNAL